jgi:hypothetical protein
MAAEKARTTKGAEAKTPAPQGGRQLLANFG